MMGTSKKIHDLLLSFKDYKSHTVAGLIALERLGLQPRVMNTCIASVRSDWSVETQSVQCLLDPLRPPCTASPHARWHDQLGREGLAAKTDRRDCLLLLDCPGDMYAPACCLEALRCILIGHAECCYQRSNAYAR